MKEPRVYRKLAGAHQFGIAEGGWLSLHLGTDHLLLRSTRGFVETYRRFYFTDIEAMIVTRTVRGIFLNAIFAFGLFASLVAILIGRGPHPVAWSLSAIFGVSLLINVLRGATCVAHVQTRVQTRPLPIRRLRKALRVVGELSPAIAAAQAHIATAPAAATPHTPAIPPPSVTPQGSGALPPPLPGARPPAASGIHLATFAVLVLSAASAYLSVVQPDRSAFAYLCYAMMLANLGLGIFALIRQARSRVPRQITPIAWISVLAHSILLPIVYTVYGFVYGIRNVAHKPAAPSFQLPLSELRGLEGFTELLTIYAAAALLLGLVGCVLFIMTSRGRRPAAS
jgi:hypothetical protein